MITITDAAVEKIKELSDEEGLDYYIVRAKVIGFGCSGMGHDLCFDNNISEDDEVLEKDGIKVIIDQMSYQYLENATIDFVEGDFQSGFKFLSPDIKSTCGCGSSVSY
jgi:iron-sulfur cluster insertion protein